MPNDNKPSLPPGFGIPPRVPGPHDDNPNAPLDLPITYSRTVPNPPRRKEGK